MNQLGQNMTPNYGLGVGAMDQTQTRQAEIPHQLERLERTLKGCLQALDTLGAKLEGSVMRGEAPAVGNEKSAASVPSTALGSTLMNAVQVVAQINARIESMTQRLEV